MLSEALCWILLNIVKKLRRILNFLDSSQGVLHLLDYFLLIDPPLQTSHSLLKLIDLFNRVGVPLSEKKTVGLFKKLESLDI